MRTPKEIERRVKEILDEQGIKSAPVDVVAIAEALGAEVRPEIAADDVSGGLYRIEGSPVIGVNAAHHPNRQRFTIAHEIGHLVFHDHGEFVDHGYPTESTLEAEPRFMRSKLSSRATDVSEIEANRFAASLLMPEHLLIKSARDLAIPVRSEAVEDLARQFKVSQQAMTFRLQNIGVPLDQV